MSPHTYQHPNPEEFMLARIFSALSDPTRLEMVKRLKDNQEHDSLTLAEGMPRSTLTYHTRILREAGITRSRGEGRTCMISLRTQDLEKRFPGLLENIIKHT